MRADEGILLYAVTHNSTLTDLRLEGNKLQLLPSEMYVMTWVKSLHLRDNGENVAPTLAVAMRTLATSNNKNEMWPWWLLS